MLLCAHTNNEGVIYMPKFVKCKKSCKASIEVMEFNDEREIKEVKTYEIKLPEGWWFYYLSSSDGNYLLAPVKRQNETGFDFEDGDKEKFEQGFWDDVRDGELKELKLDEYKEKIKSRHCHCHVRLYVEKDKKNLEIYER